MAPALKYVALVKAGSVVVHIKLCRRQLGLSDCDPFGDPAFDDPGIDGCYRTAEPGCMSPSTVTSRSTSSPGVDAARSMP